jgi:hypothetical protein
MLYLSTKQNNMLGSVSLIYISIYWNCTLRLVNFVFICFSLVNLFARIINKRDM